MGNTAYLVLGFYPAMDAFGCNKEVIGIADSVENAKLMKETYENNVAYEVDGCYSIEIIPYVLNTINTIY